MSQWTDEQARERAAKALEDADSGRYETVIRTWVDGESHPPTMMVDTYRHLATVIGRALLALEARVKELEQERDEWKRLAADAKSALNTATDAALAARREVEALRTKYEPEPRVLVDYVSPAETAEKEGA